MMNKKKAEKKKAVKKKTPENFSHLQEGNPEQSMAGRQQGNISSKEPFFSVDPELGLGPMPWVPTPTALARPVTTQPPGSSQSRAGVDYSLRQHTNPGWVSFRGTQALITQAPWEGAHSHSLFLGHGAPGRGV